MGRAPSPAGRGMSNPNLVLSLFPGAGLLDMAFEQEGFCIVRGPDLLWGGDIKTFHPPAGVFEGVIGGPPCQAFSQATNVDPNGRASHQNLIPEFERCIIESRPRWFLMENVKQAPVPAVEGYITQNILLNNRWLGASQNRLRRFTFGACSGITITVTVETSALEHIDWEPAVTGSAGGARRNPIPSRARISESANLARRRSVGERLTLMGLKADYNLAFLTRTAAIKAIGNGVPLPMGRAVAKAVKRAMYPEMVAP